jgi:dihydrofolate synthase/folylpolyglutamate synthase
MPTYFEATTAAAFAWFRRERVDVAVLEVGLGGRFDATNVVTPAAVGITSIDLDHERHLGYTLAEIAFEKAGVIKPGVTVVSGVAQPEPAAVIAEACRVRGAALVLAHRDTRATFAGREVTLRTPGAVYGPLALALPGRHQAGNAAVAVRLLESLRGGAFDTRHEDLVWGLQHAEWPGRLQKVERPGGRVAILDGAHNPAGARALAAYLREVYPDRLPVVFGAMRDKDVRGMLDAILPCASVLVATEPPMRRALPAEEIAALAAGGSTRVDVEASPAAAVERAFDQGRTICVAGSLFLVGDVLRSFGMRA